MPTKEYFKEYMRLRYADTKNENELWYCFRKMFDDGDRTAEYIRRRELRRQNPDLILKSIHLLVADPETRRLERLYAGQKFRELHRYDNYYTDDPTSDIRKLFK